MEKRKLSKALLSNVVYASVLCLELIVSLSLYSNEASASVVKKIEVRGIRRVSADSIRSNIVISPGKVFSGEEIDDSLRRLYRTGYFSDVKISVSGSVLIVFVKENDLINQVVFNGNKNIKDDKLQLIVKARPTVAYSRVLVDSDISAIKKAYSAIGRSEVSVSSQVFSVGEGRVNLAYVINEGGRTKLGKINFVGNKAYSAVRLRSAIISRQSNIISFITRSDIYSKEKLDADGEAIRKFYSERGYADFQIVSSQAFFDQAKNSYSLTFNINEGARYKFGNISVQSSVQDIDPDKLRKFIQTKTRDVYNFNKVEKSIEAMSGYLTSIGKPFIKITSRISRNLQTSAANVEYLVDKGERIYLERIDIRGNVYSRDFIIRREFDLSEGDALNESMITTAKRRLMDTGYFTSVNISKVLGSAPDRVILVVEVQEQSTGRAGIGTTYSGRGVFGLEASVEEHNFFGRGQYIRIAAGAGDSKSRSYNLSFTEPYFLGHRIAAGFDLSAVQSSDNTFFSEREHGVDLRVTVPITEEIGNTFRYSYKHMNYKGIGDWKNPANLSDPYRELIRVGKWNTSAVSQTIAYDTLDNHLLPREGILAKFTHEYAGLGGDSKYYKVLGKVSYFQLLIDDADVIGSVSAGAGHVMPINGKLYIFDQFMFNPEELRGFKNKGIGPRMANGDPVGGNTYFTAGAESNFPLPLLPRDLNLRGSFFVNAGTLYGNSVDIGSSGPLQGDSPSFRVSAGVGLMWHSPIGDIGVYYAVPLHKEPYDRLRRISFSLGNRF
ncbi:Outer membrane protein assembly factor YaeT precursor [Liberibacter crescens BT-1]|uniref:Outer membrane protein assembly factor BamA n=1 Tax=Liberibacter crescens (strain BT-1) TaxID=1215343 RepID=L0ET98_LIBCB|nr:outer membrane protein assembly factor BamA [Liberibacter crescens]AGA64040.1 Outer membrane protein assembly factor YaeT precursor [Liberibacter crescens BT-1]AMC12345.1 outer membrane protein assembly protein YaeT [Liberibacter crescens]